MFVELDVLNQQTKVTIDIEKLRQAAMAVLQAEHVASAVLSVTVVDNSTIHVINRDHLNHDYPTDVISFQLEFSSDARGCRVRAVIHFADRGVVLFVRRTEGTHFVECF